MSAALVVFAGCGGSSSAIGASGAMPQGATTKVSAHRATDGALIYVSHSGGVSIFSYPDGQLLSRLTGFDSPAGLCVDGSGDVFVVDHSAETISEYAHGASVPIAVLDDTGNLPHGCSVNPATNDLAVVGGGEGHGSNLSVFKNARGKPITFTDPWVGAFFWCAYDGQGNVFVTPGAPGKWFDELPSGGNQLVSISVNHKIISEGAVQWDGSYLAINEPQSPQHTHHKPTTIYRVNVVGTEGVIVGTIHLKSNRRNPGYNTPLWIQQGNILSPELPLKNVGVWQYQAGGKPLSAIEVTGGIFGITVSAGTQ